MVNGKRKGNSYELAVGKRFSTEFNADFRRVPSSGALTGGMNRERAQTLRADAKEILSGDLLVPEGFAFSVECKSYANDPAFHKILAGEDKILDGWIRQNDGDAEFVNKHPLLIFKICRKGEFAAVNIDCPFIVDLEKFPHMIYKTKILMSLDTFFKVVDKNKVLPIND